MAISYQSDTSPLYAGRFAPDTVPVWRSAISGNQWGRVPLTNNFIDIDPEDNPLINPNYPSDAPWRANGGLKSLFTAWCGQTTDVVKSILHWALNGGHADYAGNESYRLNLNVDSPTVELVSLPSGAIGNEGVLNDGQEATGDYFDGGARSIHSYNKGTFVTGLGTLIVTQGNTAWSGQSGTARAILVDVDTGAQTFTTPCPQVATSGSCYDPSRNAAWAKGRGTCAMWKLDLNNGVAAATWEQRGSSVLGNRGTALVYLPDSDCIFLVSEVYTNGFAIFDCVTNTYHEPSILGAFVGMTMTEHCQPVLTNGGYLALWDNSTDTTIINTLTVPVDPRTDDWVIGQLTVDGANVIVPTVKQGNGTYGRFSYLPELDGFCVFNAYDEEPYFFALGAQ
jgi:hypothetical protein